MPELAQSPRAGSAERSERAPFAALAVYDLALFVVGLLALPWLAYRAATRDRYRRGLAERLALRLPARPSGGARVWVHAASAGEMTAAAAVVRALRAERADLDVTVSSTTAAGVDVASRLLPELARRVQPIDFGPCVRRVIERLDPAVLVLVELELWPNLVAAARARGTRIVVANGRIGERTARRLQSRLARRLVGLAAVDRFAVQDGVYADRLAALGVPRERIAIAGNAKVDSAPRPVDRGALRAQLGCAPGARAIVAGSTHAGEERLLAESAAALRAGGVALTLVAAPRHKERLADAERDLAAGGSPAVRWSAVKSGAAPGPTIVVDTMGELAELYAAADVAVVGGSLVDGVGGHNVFEPALAGVPTLVGACHRNVRSDVLYLEQAGALRVVPDGSRLTAELARALGPEGAAMRTAAMAAMERARGAAARTARVILECLSPIP